MSSHNVAQISGLFDYDTGEFVGVFANGKEYIFSPGIFLGDQREQQATIQQPVGDTLKLVTSTPEATNTALPPACTGLSSNGTMPAQVRPENSWNAAMRQVPDNAGLACEHTAKANLQL